MLIALFSVLFLALETSLAESQPVPLKYVTLHERIACMLPSWYEEMQSAEAQKDMRAREHLLTSKKCFMPKSGLEVSVLSAQVWGPLTRLKVRLYLPNSPETLEVWMSGADIYPVAR